MSLDHVNSNMKAGLGRRFRSDNLKSGELLTIGIEMILTVDRKHDFLCIITSVIFSGVIFFLHFLQKRSAFSLPIFKHALGTSHLTAMNELVILACAFMSS